MRVVQTVFDINYAYKRYGSGKGNETNSFREIASKCSVSTLILDALTSCLR